MFTPKSPYPFLQQSGRMPVPFDNLGSSNSVNPVLREQPSSSSNKAGVNSDPRAILKPKSGAMQFYLNGGELLKPLQQTNGLVFPYTPDVTFGATSDFMAPDMTHTNYKYNSWKESYPKDIRLSAAIFTAQTVDEAKYMVSALHFLSCVKLGMFGNSPKVGSPPPVLEFSYLGPHMFKNVPVVLIDYEYLLPKEVDYIPVSIGGSTSSVPVKLELNIILRPTYNTSDVRQFNVQKFINGDYIKSGPGFK